MTRALSGDWERMYGHPVYFAETFIDPGRFRGTCYRAANWQLLGLTTGRGKNDQTNKPNRPIKEILGLALDAAFPRVAQPAMTMKTGALDVNLEELDQIIDRSTTRAAERIGRPEAQNRAACAGGETGAEAEHGENQRRSAARMRRPRASRMPAKSAPVGHGRNGAAAFTGANRVAIAHATLHTGDPCPECRQGKVYRQKEPATLVRIVGHAPLEATVFEMERLRCNACGQVFTAEEPEDGGRGEV